jgi:hypothetical protein
MTSYRMLPANMESVTSKKDRSPLPMSYRGDQLALGQSDRHQAVGRWADGPSLFTCRSMMSSLARASARRGQAASGFEPWLRKEIPRSKRQAADPARPDPFSIGNGRGLLQNPRKFALRPRKNDKLVK